MSTCVLVACCAGKLAWPAPAQDIYISPLFKKSRAFAERYGDRWLVLSAKYGIVRPGDTIAPYNETLNGKSAEYRKAWADNTSKQLFAELSGGSGLIVLAGKAYRQYLDLSFASWVGIPMNGLGIGQQLAWLDSRI